MTLNNFYHTMITNQSLIITYSVNYVLFSMIWLLLLHHRSFKQTSQMRINIHSHLT